MGEMTAQTGFYESCRAIPRLIESLNELVIFNVDFIVYKITPPNILQNQFWGAPLP